MKAKTKATEKKTTRAQPLDVAAYIASAPKASQPMLRQLRKTIRAAAPKAEERISYGMPFYEQQGRLVYFGGYEHHMQTTSPPGRTILVNAQSEPRV